MHQRSSDSTSRSDDRLPDVMKPPLEEWRRLIKHQIRLRARIHHAHKRIIDQLETDLERAEMTRKLDQANALLHQLKQLVGEV